MSTISERGYSSQETLRADDIHIPDAVDFWQKTGQIKKSYPNDILTQQKITNILNQPMPLSVKNEKLKDFVDGMSTPMTSEDYAKEFYEYYISLAKRRINRTLSDSSC
jgi:hypothetical protein